jgi:plastocyanin
MTPVRSFALLAVLALVTVLPAQAAVPKVTGTVGPGFTIGIKRLAFKPGKTTLTVADKSGIHDFHLIGPGVNVRTSIVGTGTKTFNVTLKRGLYRFICDPHATIMKGSFRVR